MANNSLEFSAYPVRILFSAADTAYKIVKFKPVNGPYEGKEVTLKGTFVNPLTQKDVEEATLFNFVGRLDSRPNKYNSITIFVSSDSKGINFHSIDNRSINWINIFLKRVGLLQRTRKELLEKYKAQNENDAFTKLMMQVDDPVKDSRSNKPFNIRNLFEANFSQLKDALLLLNGISETTVDGYANRIKNANDHTRILSDFEYETTKRNYSLTDSNMDAILGHYGGSVNKSLEVMDHDFYQLTNVKGISIGKTDKIYLSNKNNHLYDLTRLRSAIMVYLNQQFEDHHSWMTLIDVTTYLLSSITQNDEINNEIKAKVKSNILTAVNQLVQEDKLVVYQDKDKTARVITKQIFDFERNLYGMLKEVNESKHIPNKFAPEIVQKGIEWAENKQGFKFTAEQIEVIKGALSNNIVAINGYAGTGKSSIVRAINKILSLSKMSVTQVAFTGRAADSLSKSSGAPAQTVHSALAITNDHDVDKIFSQVASLKGMFKDNIDERFPSKVKADNTFPQLPNVYSNAIIVDEYPTLSIILFAALVYSALEQNQKLILIGDSGQLPAINFSTDQAINNIPFIKHYNLSSIKRQAGQSKIIEHSLEVRQGEVPKDVIQNRAVDSSNAATFDDINYDFIKNIDVAKTEVMSIINMLINLKHVKKEEILVLSPLNKFNDTINDLVQSKSLETNTNDKLFFNIGEGHKKPVYLNDLVINTVNQSISGVPEDNGKQSSFRIYNGNVGKVINIYHNKKSEKCMDVDFGPLGIAHYIDKDKASVALNLAYAITTHKAQGSTIKYVIGVFMFGMGDPSSSMNSRQMLYTMMTRPSDKLFIVTNMKSLKSGIDNNININARSNFAAISNPDEIVKIVGN